MGYAGLSRRLPVGPGLRSVFALLSALALVLGACAPAAAPEPTEPPATEAPEPTQAPQVEPTETEVVEPAVVTIGVLNPTSGGLAFSGEQTNTGIQLYFDSHEIPGVEVELVYADTAGDPQQALEQARRLVEQEGVDFLMGLVNSAVAVPVAQYADETQVPLLIVVAGARAATGPDRSSYIFRTAMANGQQDAPLGWYTATELGLSRAATLAWDFLVGEERAGAFAEQFTAAGGTIVTEQKPPLGTTDYGPFISQVDPEEVEVVYAFFAGPGAIAFMQQMSEFGLLPGMQVTASGYFTAGVLGAMGEPALGLVQGVQYTPSLDNGQNAAFLELFDAEVGGVPGVYEAEGYLGAEVAARAIEAVAGDLSDPQAFLDALASLEFDSLAGPFRFGDNGQSVRDVYITRVVQNDEGVLVHEVISVIEGVSQDWAPE